MRIAAFSDIHGNLVAFDISSMACCRKRDNHGNNHSD